MDLPAVSDRAPDPTRILAVFGQQDAAFGGRSRVSGIHRGELQLNAPSPPGPGTKGPGVAFHPCRRPGKAVQLPPGAWRPRRPHGTAARARPSPRFEAPWPPANLPPPAYVAARGLSPGLGPVDPPLAPHQQPAAARRPHAEHLGLRQTARRAATRPAQLLVPVPARMLLGNPGAPGPPDLGLHTARTAAQPLPNSWMTFHSLTLSFRDEGRRGSSPR